VAAFATTTESQQPAAPSCKWWGGGGQPPQNNTAWDVRGADSAVKALGASSSPAASPVTTKGGAW
jgi:hypothetical protein